MLSDTLKQLREKCGYTQQDLANALKIDRSTYTYYETGKTSPSISTVVKLAQIFNVSYSVLLDSNTENVAEGKTTYKRKRASENTTFELNKKERTLLMHFRLMDKEMQDEFIESASAAINEK